MSINVFGNAPNQIPTNADLGGMAYQDPRYVVVLGGNVNPTNFGTSNAQILFGNVTGIQHLAATAGNITTLVADNFSAGNVNMVGSITTTGTAFVNNSTDSSSPITGALRVAGGAGIGGNLHIGGNLFVTGNTFTLSTTDVSIQDAIIELHTFANLSALTTNDGRDIGIKFHYYDVADSHAFLGRANDTGYLEWYAKGTETTGNIFVGSYYGTIKSGEVVLTNTTVSTSTTTGALVVSGGAGIADGLYVNGTTYLQNASSPNIIITGGSITAVTAAATTLVATNFSSANIYQSAADTLVATNFSTTNVRATSGSITGFTGAATTLVATNFSSANIYQSAADTLVATNFSTGNVRVTGGSATGITAAATTLVATNFSSGNIYQSAAGTLVATNFSSGNIYQSAADTLVATNFSSGNLRVTGNITVGPIPGGTAYGNLIINGNAYINNGAYDIQANSIVTRSYVDLVSIIFGV